MIPALFVSHGSPMTALDHGPYFQALRAFGARHQPRAVVIVSGHWEQGPPVAVSSLAQQKLIYDFSGFPPELYALQYPAPGDPELARRIVILCETAGIAALPAARGLDHGAWTPLRMLYPDAGVPVLEVSLPAHRTPRSVFQLGQALASLRDENILILASGGTVHNLYLPRGEEDAAPQDWAVAFDTWIEQAVAAYDLEALFEYRTLAPHARNAVPTTDHFDPIFAVLGAAITRQAETVYTGFQYGHISLRCFSLG